MFARPRNHGSRAARGFAVAAEGEEEDFGPPSRGLPYIGKWSPATAAARSQDLRCGPLTIYRKEHAVCCERSTALATSCCMQVVSAKSHHLGTLLKATQARSTATSARYCLVPLSQRQSAVALRDSDASCAPRHPMNRARRKPKKKGFFGTA